MKKVVTAILFIIAASGCAAKEIKPATSGTTVEQDNARRAVTYTQAEIEEIEEHNRQFDLKNNGAPDDDGSPKYSVTTSRDPRITTNNDHVFNLERQFDSYQEATRMVKVSIDAMGVRINDGYTGVFLDNIQGIQLANLLRKTKSDKAYAVKTHQGGKFRVGQLKNQIIASIEVSFGLVIDGIPFNRTYISLYDNPRSTRRPILRTYVITQAQVDQLIKTLLTEIPKNNRPIDS